MRRHPIPVVAACIVERYPLSVLLHKKFEAEDEKGIKRNPELVGFWEFPGGMIEKDEPPEKALQREIFEELEGITIEVGKLITAKNVLFKDKKPYLVLFYYCWAPTHYQLENIKGCKFFTREGALEVKDNIVEGDLDVLLQIFKEQE